MCYLECSLVNECAAVLFPKIREYEAAYEPEFHSIKMARLGWNAYLHLMNHYRIHTTHTADISSAKLSLVEWEAEWLRVFNMAPKQAYVMGVKWEIGRLDTHLLKRMVKHQPHEWTLSTCYNPLASRAFFRSVQKKAHSEVLSDRSSARGTMPCDASILLLGISAFQKGHTLYASEQA
jgi:hypothetical protein